MEKILKRVISSVLALAMVMEFAGTNFYEFIPQVYAAAETTEVSSEAVTESIDPTEETAAEAVVSETEVVSETIVETAIKENAKIIGLSALMTTTMMQMQV